MSGISERTGGGVHVVSPIDLLEGGQSLLAVRYAEALESTGTPATAWLPRTATHPDERAARRFDDLPALLEDLGEDHTIVVGVPRGQAAAQSMIDCVAGRRDRTVVWERPGFTVTSANDGLARCSDVRRIVTLNPRFVASLTAGFPMSEVKVWPLALPPACFVRGPELSRARGSYAIVIGRASPAKRTVELAERWSAEFADLVDLDLVVASPDGNPFADLDRVRWTHLGEVGERVAALRGAAVAIFPASDDHLPQALVEAMAASTPVLATAIDGHLEIVEDRVTGRTMDLSMDDLVAVVNEMDGEPDTTLGYATAARNLVEARFSYAVTSKVVRASLGLAQGGRGP